MKKIAIYTIGIIIFLTVILIGWRIIQKPKRTTWVTLIPIPTLAPEKGQGIDVSSSAVKNSLKEIRKLSPVRLPYIQKLALSTGQSVEVVIPPRNLEAYPWILTIQIFGLNYQTIAGEDDYEIMEKSFHEAARYVFDWMRDNGAEPTKILINWGDQAYIQETAEQWLRSL